jgi:hypothetical protein
MSFTKEVRNNRPRTGNTFPAASPRFTDAIAAALHRQYGDSHGAIKSVMRVTGVAERTVENWFQAKNGPNGESLVRLCRHSDQVLEAVLLLSGREKQLKIKKLGEIRAALKQMLVLLSEIDATR